MPESPSVAPERLRRELVRRGWDGSDLARAAKISCPTVTSALHGRPLKIRTIVLIAKALVESEVIPGIDDLLNPDEQGTP